MKHNGNNNLIPEDTAFLMPCIFMVQYCFASLGVKLGNKIGIRLNILISLIIIYISLGIMIFSTNYYVILLAMGIFGLGDGLETLSVINNCWKYFPGNTGLVNGIIITGLGISSGILTPIGDYIIINPKKVDPEDDIYPDFVANNLKDFLYFLTILFIILGFFGILLSFNYEKEYKDQEDNIPIISSNELNDKDIEKTKNNSHLILLCEGFLSEKNFFLLLFCFCTPCKYILI